MIQHPDFGKGRQKYNPQSGLRRRRGVNPEPTLLGTPLVATSGSSIDHPLVIIDRSDVVASVSGRNVEMYLSTVGMPSIGHITPLSSSVG
ncbi:hypothetical protein NQ318_008659 [Aromia moschata]|uniref:Uncharacterized protein n=1 Tax=Aromia moschata TaxID=1265417 RepID=A0AAV8XKE0_9CUCU|nr:hypothetical protein NQ318_008659 [Aromia moschata]